MKTSEGVEVWSTHFKLGTKWRRLFSSRPVLKRKVSSACLERNSVPSIVQPFADSFCSDLYGKCAAVAVDVVGAVRFIMPNSF
jgi:hypothetical protein